MHRKGTSTLRHLSIHHKHYLHHHLSPTGRLQRGPCPAEVVSGDHRDSIKHPQPQHLFQRHLQRLPSLLTLPVYIQTVWRPFNHQTPVLQDPHKAKLVSRTQKMSIYRLRFPLQPHPDREETITLPQVPQAHRRQTAAHPQAHHSPTTELAATNASPAFKTCSNKRAVRLFPTGTAKAPVSAVVEGGQTTSPYRHRWTRARRRLPVCDLTPFPPVPTSSVDSDQRHTAVACRGGALV